MLYHTSETKLVSLKEYVDAMPAEQTKIYFCLRRRRQAAARPAAGSALLHTKRAST
ncbi:MAG: hypothetical protein ACLUNO_09910, partial [Oscillospiraceae bacterium]